MAKMTVVEAIQELNNLEALKVFFDGKIDENNKDVNTYKVAYSAIVRYGNLLSGILENTMIYNYPEPLPMTNAAENIAESQNDENITPEQNSEN